MSNLKTQNQNLNLKTDLRKRSFRFSLMVLEFVKLLPNTKVYWVITDQLIRAATSIGANIIEARSSSSKRDFIRFYEIALKSANETRYWLYLLREGMLVEREKVDDLIKEVEEIGSMLGSSLLTLKGKKKL
ncbi:MAG: four helix bundle protein [Candidatus Anstonellales archaeon]